MVSSSHFFCTPPNPLYCSRPPGLPQRHRVPWVWKPAWGVFRDFTSNLSSFPQLLSGVKVGSLNPSYTPKPLKWFLEGLGWGSPEFLAMLVFFCQLFCMVFLLISVPVGMGKTSPRDISSRSQVGTNS